MDLLSPVGDKANFDFSVPLAIVNCNFAQNFSSDSMRRHGGHFKISCVWNSCESKKLGRKIYIFFCDFLESGVEFWRSICTGLWRSGALQNGCKKLGDFLETFPPEGAKIFHRGLFEGPLEIYLLIVQGHHLCHSVEGRWWHSCVTIPLKKVNVDTMLKKGAYVRYKKLTFSTRQFGRNFAGSRQGAQNRLRICRVCPES